MTKEIINNTIENEVMDNAVEVVEEVAKAVEPKKLLDGNFGKGMIAGAVLACTVKIAGPAVLKGGKKVGKAVKKLFNKDKHMENDDFVEGDAVEIVEEDNSENTK